MKRIFNTPNFLILGIAVAAAGLLYLGLIFNCSAKHDRVVNNNDFTTEISVPA
ncbi:hypothetical protein [Flavobacterium sp.]|uniref:hypothetical protein n=1 Tax=Flavobacterium sp. TaxID=239 RepID=UPI0025BF54B0|nr:hypothetical protein [Flavobacterium sp.]